MADPWKRKEVIGGQTLYLGDCLEVMPALGKVDAVKLKGCAIITDPPYGINYLAQQPGAVIHERINGDDGSLSLQEMIAFNGPVLAFGANNFPEQLPHRGRWLCWDKRTIDGACDAMMGSPFELAWANKKTGYDKIVRILHGGAVNADGGRRVHPTQKPIQLMVAAIRWAAIDAETILDPFMGSGTTLVACAKLGRKGIGIDLDPDYFDIACKRVEEAYRQPDLFIEQPKPQSKQEGFDL